MGGMIPGKTIIIRGNVKLLYLGLELQGGLLEEVGADHSEATGWRSKIFYLIKDSSH